MTGTTTAVADNSERLVRCVASMPLGYPDASRTVLVDVVTTLHCGDVMFCDDQRLEQSLQHA